MKKLLSVLSLVFVFVMVGCDGNEVIPMIEETVEDILPNVEVKRDPVAIFESDVASAYITDLNHDEYGYYVEIRLENYSRYEIIFVSDKLFINDITNVQVQAYENPVSSGEKEINRIYLDEEVMAEAGFTSLQDEVRVSVYMEAYINYNE